MHVHFEKKVKPVYKTKTNNRQKVRIIARDDSLGVAAAIIAIRFSVSCKTAKFSFSIIACDKQDQKRYSVRGLSKGLKSKGLEDV
jgi:hypothetical protein